MTFDGAAPTRVLSSSPGKYSGRDNGTIVAMAIGRRLPAHIAGSQLLGKGVVNMRSTAAKLATAASITIVLALSGNGTAVAQPGSKFQTQGIRQSEGLRRIPYNTRRATRRAVRRGAVVTGAAVGTGAYYRGYYGTGTRYYGGTGYYGTGYYRTGGLVGRGGFFGPRWY